MIEFQPQPFPPIEGTDMPQRLIRLSRKKRDEILRVVTDLMLYSYNWLSSHIYPEVKVARAIYNLKDDPDWDEKFKIEQKIKTGLVRSYIDTIVNSLAGSVFPQSPFFYCRPVEAVNQKAEEASDRVERFIDILLREKDIETIGYEALRLAAIDGTAFIRTTYDDRANNGKGDINIDLKDIFEVMIIRPDATSWGKVWGIGVKRWVTWNTLKDEFRKGWYYKDIEEEVLNTIVSIPHLDDVLQEQTSTRIYPLWEIEAKYDYNDDGIDEPVDIVLIFGEGYETSGNYLLGVYERKYKELERTITIVKLEEHLNRCLYGRSLVANLQELGRWVDYYANCAALRTAFDILPPFQVSPQIKEILSGRLEPGMLIPVTPNSLIQAIPFPTPLNVIVPMMQMAEQRAQQLSGIPLLQMGMLPPAKTSATAASIASRSAMQRGYVRLRAVYKQFEYIPHQIVKILKQFLRQTEIKRRIEARGGLVKEEKVMLSPEDLQYEYQFFIQGSVAAPDLEKHLQYLLLVARTFPDLFQDPKKKYSFLRTLFRVMGLQDYEEILGTEDELNQQIAAQQQAMQQQAAQQQGGEQAAGLSPELLTQLAQLGGMTLPTGEEMGGEMGGSAEMPEGGIPEEGIAEE